ncbi:hypothetical protein JMJ35_003579 [Cladonia borealis]|uniref:NAD(P)-binding protein n=1 Tax=Cladonia borealis TaxID=184061 RepID=A0AA39R2T2_9LECA|nr:hypothetical protein JMJ35_003579 [Cladonia borealis]
MPLTILSDADIHSLLLSLTRDDILLLQHNLSEALHDYSTGTQETTVGCSANQPQRIGVPAANNQTTLFMPASTSTSRGIKIVTLATVPVPSREPSISKLSIDSPRSSSPVSQSPSNTSSRPLPLTHLLPNHNPRGSLTLLTSTGVPYAFISAEALTAFRTALASTIILSRRTSVHSITVFGAGAQASWHIRLALLLRGSEIHHIDIVNRSFTRAKNLMQEFYTSPSWETLRNSNPKLAFSIVSAEYGEYQRLLKEHVRKADVIFLCTPSTAPLFPAEYLTSASGRQKGRYISAIGSYRPHMVELHPDILRQAVAPEHKHHHHKHADKGGVIVVDSLSACLKEAGEIIQAGVTAEQLVEVGELLMVKKASMREIELGTGEGEKGLKKWLMGGNVIYKSVGLGLMDICVGEDLVALAMERGIGTTVAEF